MGLRWWLVRGDRRGGGGVGVCGVDVGGGKGRVRAEMRLALEFAVGAEWGW